jgi:hypothetical protein
VVGFSVEVHNDYELVMMRYLEKTSSGKEGSARMRLVTIKKNLKTGMYVWGSCG